MVFILIVVLLVLLGFLVWGWDRVDLRDAQGRLLNRKIQLKSADEGSLIGLAYGVYTFEIWHRGILQWKPRLVKRIIVEHDKITENEWLYFEKMRELSAASREEYRTSREIFEACRGQYFKILHKVCLLRNSLDDTTVVETLLLDSTGIYLFENVPQQGWIFGDAKEKNWSATKMNDDKMHGKLFDNPLLSIARNEAALRRLFESFDGLSLHVFSYAVFNDGAVLKQIPDNTVSQKIILRSQLRESLVRMFRLANPVYSEYEIDKLERELANYSS